MWFHLYFNTTISAHTHAQTKNTSPRTEIFKGLLMCFSCCWCNHRTLWPAVTCVTCSKLSVLSVSVKTCASYLYVCMHENLNSADRSWTYQHIYSVVLSESFLISNLNHKMTWFPALYCEEIHSKTHQRPRERVFLLFWSLFDLWHSELYWDTRVMKVELILIEQKSVASTLFLLAQLAQSWK